MPRDAATIQAAVDRARNGAIIKVAPGRYCGATIDKEVHLHASWATTIVGCPAPLQSPGLRAGFLLVDDSASGTSIHGFRFDGTGVSEDNLDPLSFAILSRGAHDVVVSGNRITGTVQGITNSGGEGWVVLGNDITDLTLFGCRDRCGGGVGIVMQQRDRDGDRASRNVVQLNQITGAIPDGHDQFDMVGVFVLGQDRPLVSLNRFYIPENPAAPARGIGIQVSDTCCGDVEPYLTTRCATIVNNDGRHSQFVLVIDRDASGGTGNTRGATIRHNRGVSLINGRQRIDGIAPPTTALADPPGLTLLLE